ncbi:MAG: malto-oligosyltrehalose trehalohydrolase [Deltaproteobacteria bacterium]|nr:malto-oligosyltrehalose trehalohydrolase [Deltaproteobacteria bacterium]MDQ3296970.1 malto-oligosyltrehalose trehalohydrolase [Myxococcota bacterium]
MIADLELGARVVPEGVRFRVWAPSVRELAVTIHGEVLALEARDRGMFERTVRGAKAGDDYAYVIDGARERPDPVSRSQPHGVHGPSRVVDPSTFSWHDAAWRGLRLDQYIIYELHVGTFTESGTFAAAITKLRHLVDLGITAVELMPVAEFPGGRNWGYDGVHLFAPQSTYGGPDELRALVDACHAEGLAVILDVVYNHVGPEGNYLAEFGPFFTDRYRTPWGRAINVDDVGSDGVRRHLITNAVHWIAEYHIDALRLDAIHGIFDFSACHILEELCAEVRSVATGRHVHVIAESDLNDTRVIRPAEHGGLGVDAQWCDDFHHAVRTTLTGDRRGYFSDFGTVHQLSKAITDSFVYDGVYSPHRGRRHGNSAAACRGEQFVICLQNHDQVANGSQGRRLSDIAGHRRHALAAVLLLTAPNVPMLFMGEEYAERAPFVYFISHSDPALVSAVRAGRLLELGDLAAGELAFADPQAEATFEACKLDWSLPGALGHAEMLALYRDLIALRRSEACLGNCRKDLTRVSASDAERWIIVERGDPSGRGALVVCNLRESANEIQCVGPTATYRLALTSEDPRYGGASPAAPTLELRGEPVTIVLPPHAARVYVTSDLPPQRLRAAARPGEAGACDLESGMVEAMR